MRTPFDACRRSSRVVAAVGVWLSLASIACTPNAGVAPSPGASASVREPSAPKPLDVRVMSFNIRNGKARDGANAWEHRTDLVFRTIRDYVPDVVGIQEAFRFQLDEIGRAVPGYGEIGTGRDGGTRGEYSAILFRADRFDVADSGTFWLSDTPEVPSRHWGNACIRVCTWARLVGKRDEDSGASASAFYIFNTHLDHRSQPSREKAVRLIARRIAARAHADPVVVTGDLNAGERNPVVRYLLGGEGGASEASPVPLVDSYRVLHPDEKAVGTFHRFTGIAPGAKIDYVLVPPGAEVLEATIVRTPHEGRFPSDHFPVTARVRLPQTHGN
jgi:endonuclease/exonuclease/phosphatase family metal-dependent hydrolase